MAAGTGNGWGGPHLFPREQVQTSTGHGTRGALPQGPVRLHPPGGPWRTRRPLPATATEAWPASRVGPASGYDGPTMDLFSSKADQLRDQEAPLAARMRPRTLEEFVGQGHVLGPGSALRALIQADELRSVILWGPAGTGKTSLAHIIARATRSHFEELSATSAGVKDVRAMLAAARQRLGAMGRRSILFIDEIHRFNKGQQDALLPGVEDRTVVLVGATTENPFFTVNAPLMSRSLLFRLEPLGPDDLELIVTRALADPARGLGGRGLALDPDALAHLVDRADGDARHALNALEAAVLVVTARGQQRLTLGDIEDALQRPRVTYDRAGDQHYDVASAFIKSIRGSDPDAALHYLARMLAAGEDPRFVARRLVISASAWKAATATRRPCRSRSPPSRRWSSSGCPRPGSTWPRRSSTWPSPPSPTAPTTRSARRPGSWSRRGRGASPAISSPAPTPGRRSSASASATSTLTTTRVTGWPSATCRKDSTAATTSRPTRAARLPWPRRGGAGGASRHSRRPSAGRTAGPTRGAAAERRHGPGRPAGRGARRLSAGHGRRRPAGRGGWRLSAGTTAGGPECGGP